jgi:hypothetical protein
VEVVAARSSALATKGVWILGIGETEAIERGEAVAWGQEMASSTKEKKEELSFLDFGQLLCEFEMSDFTCFLLALNTFHIFLQLVLQYFDPKFILLFVSIQDLAVVVLLILIPLISPNSSKGGVRFSRHSLVKYLF